MMTLGDLIDILNGIPAKAADNILYGWGGLHSWRGDYHQLSVGDGHLRTIGDALGDCLAAQDSYFSGYKGGQYYMTKETDVWGDNFGECSGHEIIGIAFLLDEENKTNPIAKVLRSYND